MLSWLTSEARGKSVIKLMGLMLAINVLYSALAIGAIAFLEIKMPPSTPGKIQILTWDFPLMLLSMAFIEEAIFRAPLAFAAVEGWYLGNLLVLSAILSVIFGILHGGFINIFAQGISGFIYCLLFLKCGGYHGKLIKPLSITTAVHFSFNSILIFILLLGGKRYL